MARGQCRPGAGPICWCRSSAVRDPSWDRISRWSSNGLRLTTSGLASWRSPRWRCGKRAQGGKGEAAEKTTREPLSLALSPPRGEGSGADSTLGRALLWPGVVLLTLVGAIVAVARFFPYPGEFWPVTLRNGLERAMFLVSILGAV